jgi:hypothetical protein
LKIARSIAFELAIALAFELAIALALAVVLELAIEIVFALALESRRSQPKADRYGMSLRSICPPSYLLLDLSLLLSLSLSLYLSLSLFFRNIIDHILQRDFFQHHIYRSLHAFPE